MKYRNIVTKTIRTTRWPITIAGALWVALALLAAFWAVYNEFRGVNRPLLSPLVVEAKESKRISCDTPRGYLECKAYQHEITWEQHDKISRIIDCESKWNPDAYHVNTNGSVDMGIVMINSVHKNISNADKLNYKKAIDWMIAKINKDHGYGAWTCARVLKIKN